MRGPHTRWFELSGRELRVLVVAVGGALLTLAVLGALRSRLWGGELEIQAARDGLRIPARLNVNTAEQHELVLVPGIGEKTARAIIAYRREHGPFARLEDLAEVAGIGPKTVERVRPHLMCASAARPDGS